MPEHHEHNIDIAYIEHVWKIQIYKKAFKKQLPKYRLMIYRFCFKYSGSCLPTVKCVLATKRRSIAMCSSQRRAITYSTLSAAVYCQSSGVPLKCYREDQQIRSRSVLVSNLRMKTDNPDCFYVKVPDFVYFNYIVF